MKELTNADVKEAVDKTASDFWNSVIEKSKELFPDNPRSAWIFRGRIYQSLFANHFIAAKIQMDQELINKTTEIQPEKT